MEDSLSGKKPHWKTTSVEATSVEDNLSGRRPQWKMTSVEDDLSGRRPQWKTTSVEDDLSGKVPQWKTLLALNHQNICRSTLVESETILKDGRRPPWKTTPILAQPQQSSQLESELGTAQPQLVYTIVTKSRNRLYHIHDIRLFISSSNQLLWSCFCHHRQDSCSSCGKGLTIVSSY